LNGRRICEIKQFFDDQMPEEEEEYLKRREV